MERANRTDVTDRILEIVARKAGKHSTSIKPETRLLHDLGLYGDDAEEILLEAGKQFQIDYTGLEFQRYFFPEGFALWLMPRFAYRRLLERKQPLTVAALITAATTGKWERP